MKNLTLAVDEKLIEEGRKYAYEHHTSLNALLRDLLERTVRERRTDWVADCVREMDAARGGSKGKKWKREDLYRD
jgi:ribonuclease D